MSHVSRTALYCGLSTAMTVAVIVSAFEARPNFYSAAIYLSQSSACLMVLTNMFLVFTLVTGKILQKIFFGSLRAIEVDHLYERAWYAVTETCLAMTIFREEFGTTFFLFFTLLLSVKIFHWLAQDRIEYMEQTAQVARSFHLRMTSIMTLLLLLDCYMVAFAMEDVVSRGPNVMIMFAFEFTILASTMVAVIGKYVLNVIESRQTETWDNKSGYVFYLELMAEFCKLVTYVAFFATLMTFYGIPLHILRDLYVTFRSFTTKCRNFMRFRRATQDMDEKYHDATVAEIDATGDKTCIVCREEMYHESQPLPEGEPARTVFDKPKRLLCGHILHFRCLRSWLERQQTCPMCRRSVLEDAPATAQRPGQSTASGGEQRPPNGAQAANNHGNAGGSTIQATSARFQLPNNQGIEPVQLPRGFRLPPGWALLPVSGNEETRPTTAAAQVDEQASSTDTSAGTPAANSSSSRLPPIIPLFGANGFESATATTLPPTLTDAQVTAMERSTRRTVEERLRILTQLQARVTESFALLTRLQEIPLPADESQAASDTGADTSLAADEPVEHSADSTFARETVPVDAIENEPS